MAAFQMAVVLDGGGGTVFVGECYLFSGFIIWWQHRMDQRLRRWMTLGVGYRQYRYRWTDNECYYYLRDGVLIEEGLYLWLR